MKVIFAICAAIISGLLLGAAFPSYNFSFLAWIALVPLFLIFPRVRPIYGFLVSFVFGVVFYTCVFYWMFDLPKYSVLHHAILGIYLCPLLGIFGAFFCFSARRCGLTAALFSAPFIWVTFEYARSNLSFLSLPWGLLAHSQYQHPLLIQAANITGVYGISFLIVLVNSGITAILHPLLHNIKSNASTTDVLLSQRAKRAVAGAAAIAVLVNIAYGFAVTAKPLVGQSLKISVLQGNIAQSKKWDPKYASFIMQTYTDLTQKASKEKPALIVWPETSTPRSITENYGLYRRVKEIAKEAGSPLILGSSERQKTQPKDPSARKHLNSAFLIHSKPVKEKIQRYDKIRLLPFGEYMPYEETIPWSYLQIPNNSGFVPGKEYTVFRLPSFSFSVTICWENIFSEIARQFVNEGAQFIVNITNEAWFGKTATPYQFLSMSVFRAVENKIFVVRCGNTGISCIIDPYGKIVSRLKNNSGQDLFVRGVLTGSVVLSELETFYTKFGNIFVYINLMLSAVFLLFPLFKVKQS